MDSFHSQTKYRVTVYFYIHRFRLYQYMFAYPIEERTIGRSCALHEDMPLVGASAQKQRAVGQSYKNVVDCT
jgi:hypothetical protein